MKKIIGKRGIAVLLVFAIAVMGVVMGCKGGTDPTPPVNQAPTASAGSNFEHNITTSGTTVTLNGSGTDSDGNVASYAWACTSKPTGAADPSFSNSAAQNPTVSGFDKLGEYKFGGAGCQALQKHCA